MSLRRLAKSATFAAAAAGVAGFVFYQQADVDTQFALASASGPLVRLLDPETSHQLGILFAKYGLFPRDDRPDPPTLKVHVWGREFRNPLGLAAGFDKDAEAIGPLLGLGFGFIEVGSITPLPQPGNPKPRVFRISDVKATINRYGFNSVGGEAAAVNLQTFTSQAAQKPQLKPGFVAVNLGKNKTTEDAAVDYCQGLSRLGRYADFVVINISSPNTPGLRSLQGRKALEGLVSRVKATRDALEWGPSGPPPLLVKIAPDLTDADKEDIAAVAMKLKVDGLVVGNTTVSRPDDVAKYPEASEAGGLSGPPLFEMSTQVLADMYRLTKGTIPLVGCGGVSSGEDAYRKIRAGASLVELYTAMAYEGPAVVPNIKKQLAACLERDGFVSVAEAVGVDAPAKHGTVQKAKQGGWFGW